jgi:hypothetical protein
MSLTTDDSHAISRGTMRPEADRSTRLNSDRPVARRQSVVTDLNPDTYNQVADRRPNIVVTLIHQKP